MSPVNLSPQGLSIEGTERSTRVGLGAASSHQPALFYFSFQWERLWFLLLAFTFGLTLTWLYFWWEVRNDYDEFNW